MEIIGSKSDLDFAIIDAFVVVRFPVVIDSDVDDSDGGTMSVNDVVSGVMDAVARVVKVVSLDADIDEESNNVS